MVPRSSAALRVVALATTVFLWQLLLHAQDIALSGTVTDTTDAVLPGVTVTMTHTDSGNAFVGMTDVAGNYLITALRAGTYRVKINLSGFSSVNRENVELQVGQHAVLNVRLRWGSLEESITVAA